jgi:uncharacterized membrane protein YccC
MMHLNLRARRVFRIVLSYYVTSGVSAALGLFVISGSMRLWLGPFAAAAATIGIIVVIPPDQPAPRRGKFWQLVPSALVGIPLFYGVRMLNADPLHLAMLLVPGTFVAFLAAAWGRRGIPLSMSAMFSIVFAMAVPGTGDTGAWQSTLYFGVGAVAYVVYATLANAVLNGRYRVQMFADTLLVLASLMRCQARQFDVAAQRLNGHENPVSELLRGQAALADHLQVARDILLEAPRTARRQRLAGMLMIVLEMRDQLLACELDVDLVRVDPAQAPLLGLLQAALIGHAGRLEEIADCLLVGQAPESAVAIDTSAALRSPGASVNVLGLGLAARVRHISEEMQRLVALAREETQPELAVVQASWRMFVSPTSWSWLPFKGLWYADAPPLRHAIRAALAIGSAYAISLMVPWGTHAYWILLTIVVVLRGSLAQTLERRNSRVAGTLLGSVLAGVLLSLRPSAVATLLVVTLAQGIAHAFAVKRYLVTAVAATVLALLQAHSLNAAVNPAFEVFERIADTLIGVGIAWAFSYLLPAWERIQIPALIDRAQAAQARHARLCLELGQLSVEDARPELEWRLARREAYDSLSALVQATQRCLVEPRAVRPPLNEIARLLAHGYQLLAQLTAVKTMLLMRRGHLDPAQLTAPLRGTLDALDAIFGRRESRHPLPRLSSSSEPLNLPDPFGEDVTPWLLRRLQLTTDLATQLVDDAQDIEKIASMQRGK